MAPEGEGRTALQTNPAYASLFSWLGWGSAAVGAVMVLLIPFLRRLIQHRDAPQAATADPAAA